MCRLIFLNVCILPKGIYSSQALRISVWNQREGCTWRIKRTMENRQPFQRCNFGHFFGLINNSKLAPYVTVQLISKVQYVKQPNLQKPGWTAELRCFIKLDFFEKVNSFTIHCLLRSSVFKIQNTSKFWLNKIVSGQSALSLDWAHQPTSPLSSFQTAALHPAPVDLQRVDDCHHLARRLEKIHIPCEIEKFRRQEAGKKNMFCYGIPWYKAFWIWNLWWKMDHSNCSSESMGGFCALSYRTRSGRYIVLDHRINLLQTVIFQEPGISWSSWQTLWWHDMGSSSMYV